jgi:peptide deformylase
MQIESKSMSILKVARLGHPVLRKITEAVSEKELRSEATRQFVDDMIETMKEYDGVGLAADQVHVSKQTAGAVDRPYQSHHHADYRRVRR